jgi:hypothetical protein
MFENVLQAILWSLMEKHFKTRLFSSNAWILVTFNIKIILEGKPKYNPHM